MIWSLFTPSNLKHCNFVLFVFLVFLGPVSCGSADDTCKAYGKCKQTGECTWDESKGKCVAADDEDCTYRSLVCKHRGHCVAKGGTCIATTNNHCKNSTACAVELKCFAMGKTCVPKGTKPAVFGSLCTSGQNCYPDLQCVTIGDRTRGHCSKTCTSGICSGAPQGSMALCLLTSSTDKSIKYCAFVCQYKDSSGTLRKTKCPSYQTCSSTENPPGSGQRICMP